tara:strand:+ start:130 stop:480 length:351 start_codon:yes stop_codon:yes gene_type:complete
VKAEIVIFCQSELETGFIKTNGSWKIANYAPQRWTIKFSDDYSQLYFPDEERPFICSPSYSHTPNLLACLSGYSNGESFLFNKIENRFVLDSTSIRGYVDDGSDSNAFYAGTCEKF